MVAYGRSLWMKGLLEVLKNLLGKAGAKSHQPCGLGVQNRLGGVLEMQGSFHSGVCELRFLLMTIDPVLLWFLMPHTVFKRISQMLAESQQWVGKRFFPPLCVQGD